MDTSSSLKNYSEDLKKLKGVTVKELPGGIAVSKHFTEASRYALRKLEGSSRPEAVLNHLRNVVYRFKNGEIATSDGPLGREDICGGTSLYEICTAHTSTHHLIAAVEESAKQMLSRVETYEFLEDHSDFLVRKHAEKRVSAGDVSYDRRKIPFGARNSSISFLRHSASDSSIAYYLAVRTYSPEGTRRVNKRVANPHIPDAEKTYEAMANSDVYKEAIAEGDLNRNAIAHEIVAGMIKFLKSKPETERFAAILQNSYRPTGANSILSPGLERMVLRPSLVHHYNVLSTDRTYTDFYNNCYNLKESRLPGVLIGLGREHGYMLIVKTNTDAPQISHALSSKSRANPFHKDVPTNIYGNQDLYYSACLMGVPSRYPQELNYKYKELKANWDLEVLSSLEDAPRPQIEWSTRVEKHPKLAEVYEPDYFAKNLTALALMVGDETQGNKLATYRFVTVAAYISAPLLEELDIPTILVIRDTSDDMVSVPVTNPDVASGAIFALWVNRQIASIPIRDFCPQSSADYLYFSAKSLETLFF